MTAGPRIVGFTDFFENDEEAEKETVTPPETEESDIVARLEDARASLDDTGPFNSERGTDADETLCGLDTAANALDASGGLDTVTGGMLDDTLSGGEDSDTLTGGDGDDALFGGFLRETRPDDRDGDSLDGGAGDDALFLGDGDTGTGGLGADIFATVQDATGTVTITDFDPVEDSLVIETADAEDISITEQTVGTGGLTLTLGTGLTVTLQGLETELDEMDISFITVEPLAAA